MSKFYVAKVYYYSTPSIIEEFDNKADAESYAALMCRTKNESYLVLEIASRWLKRDEEE